MLFSLSFASFEFLEIKVGKLGPICTTDSIRSAGSSIILSANSDPGKLNDILNYLFVSSDFNLVCDIELLSSLYLFLGSMSIISGKYSEYLRFLDIVLAICGTIKLYTFFSEGLLSFSLRLFTALACFFLDLLSSRKSLAFS